MEDVAARAGVSRALVSLVMRASPKVSETSRAAVLAAARDLEYRPNVLARNLASHRTRTIGVMVNDLHNPFHTAVVGGIDAAAREHDYRILLNTGNGRRRGEEHAIETFLDLRADGLILIGPRLSARAIAAAAADTSVVVVGRLVRDPRVDTVTNDEGIGAQLVVDHLAALGHRRISHIDGGTGAGARSRRRGYERAMVGAGLGAYVDVIDGDYTESSGVRGADTFLSRRPRPTALFCANDLTAVGALDVFDDLAIRVPEDVSLVGYDDTPLASLRHVSLTTIHQRSTTLGHLGMATLAERLESGRRDSVRHIVTPSLVVRATTGPARKRS
jgi:DNA-binding LacI/PurR family transcriptional regulator